MDVTAPSNAEAEFTLMKKPKNPDHILVGSAFFPEIIGRVLRGIVGNFVGVTAEFYRYTVNDYTMTS